MVNNNDSAWHAHFISSHPTLLTDVIYLPYKRNVMFVLVGVHNGFQQFT